MRPKSGERARGTESRRARDMEHTHLSTPTDQALRRLYRVGFVSLGLSAFALATSTRGAAIPISIFLGILLIACAFTRLPVAIASYTRAREGDRPGYNAIGSVLIPLCLSLVTALVAYNDASASRYLSRFVTLRWTDIARPIIYGIDVLLLFGVFAANAVRLLRRRGGCT